MLGLPLVTMAAVGAAAQAVVPGIGWAEGLLLGAIVAPNDPVSAMATFERVGVTERVRVLHGRDARRGRPRRRRARADPASAVRELRRDLIGVERAALLELRNEGRLKPDVMRRIQLDVDLDEARFAASPPRSG